MERLWDESFLGCADTLHLPIRQLLSCPSEPDSTNSQSERLASRELPLETRLVSLLSAVGRRKKSQGTVEQCLRPRGMGMTRERSGYKLRDLVWD